MQASPVLRHSVIWSSINDVTVGEGMKKNIIWLTYSFLLKRTLWVSNEKKSTLKIIMEYALRQPTRILLLSFLKCNCRFKQYMCLSKSNLCILLCSGRLEELTLVVVRKVISSKMQWINASVNWMTQLYLTLNCVDALTIWTIQT